MVCDRVIFDSSGEVLERLRRRLVTPADGLRDRAEECCSPALRSIAESVRVPFRESDRQPVVAGPVSALDRGGRGTVPPGVPGMVTDELHESLGRVLVPVCPVQCVRTEEFGVHGKRKLITQLELRQNFEGILKRSRPE